MKNSLVFRVQKVINRSIKRGKIKGKERERVKGQAFWIYFGPWACRFSFFLFFRKPKVHTMTTYFRTCNIKNEGLNFDSFYKREHVMSLNYKVIGKYKAIGQRTPTLIKIKTKTKYILSYLA